MPIFSINFDDIPDYQAIPKGTYPVIVESVTMAEGPKAPYLNWDLSITEGEHEGRHLFMMTSLSDKALWRLKAVFENLGVLEEGEMEIEVDEDTNQVITPELVGQVGVADVTEEVYDNKLRNRVNDLLAPDAPVIEEPKVAPAKGKPAQAGAPAPARKPLLK